jgi:hypothetical protein
MDFTSPHGLDLSGAKLAKAEIIADAIAQMLVRRVRAFGVHASLGRVFPPRRRKIPGKPMTAWQLPGYHLLAANMSA